MIKDNDGNEYPEGKWIDVPTGKKDEDGNDITERVQLFKTRPVHICEQHRFDKNHECTKCPYVFTGFRANLHIQKDNGIYWRATGKKII